MGNRGPTLLNRLAWTHHGACAGSRICFRACGSPIAAQNKKNSHNDKHRPDYSYHVDAKQEPLCKLRSRCCARRVGRRRRIWDESFHEWVLIKVRIGLRYKSVELQSYRNAQPDRTQSDYYKENPMMYFIVHSQVY